MKADQIIKNARIFTADKKNPQATALAVKDGKFIYVGNDAGLSEYEGEVTDLGGKFIMPGIIDSHVHVTIGVAFEYTDLGTMETWAASLPSSGLLSLERNEHEICTAARRFGTAVLL